MVRYQGASRCIDAHLTATHPLTIVLPFQIWLLFCRNLQPCCSIVLFEKYQQILCGVDDDEREPCVNYFHNKYKTLSDNFIYVFFYSCVLINLLSSLLLAPLGLPSVLIMLIIIVLIKCQWTWENNNNNNNKRTTTIIMSLCNINKERRRRRTTTTTKTNCMCNIITIIKANKKSQNKKN